VVNQSNSNLSWGATFLFFLIGFLSSVAVNAGDDLGRVNLLYLVLLYVALPVVSLITLVLFAVKKQPHSFTNLLTQLPLWPRSWQEPLLKLKRDGLFQAWLFGQSQKLMLAFGMGAITSFMLILLVNDVSFVWRSTLLGAEQIFPLLNFIAAPWSFIESAQPIYQLLVSSQDSRLTSNAQVGVDYGSWWKFLVMAQFVYGIAPRIVLLCWANFRFKQQVEQRNNVKPPKVAPLINAQPQQEPLANVNDSIKLTQYSLVIWAQLPECLLQKITAIAGRPSQIYVVGPYGDLSQEQAAIDDQQLKLVVVAAWEPPMGEVMDFLALGQGYLMPLDWNSDNFNPVSTNHLDEWRRCCFKLNQWQMLQLEQIS